MVADGKIPPAGAESGFGAQRAGDVDSSTLNDVGKNVGAAYAAALIYLSTQVDRLRAAARKLVLLSILGIVALIFAATVLIYATVLLLSGVAGAIAWQLGGRQWAGDLVTGGLVVAGLAIAGFWTAAKMSRAARLRTLSSYEKRRVQK